MFPLPPFSVLMGLHDDHQREPERLVRPPRTGPNTRPARLSLRRAFGSLVGQSLSVRARRMAKPSLTTR
jgi:hypothetical protein